MKSKVTTKRGDGGATRTLGGEAVSKASLVIACTGALDAARARVALLRLRMVEAEGYAGEAAFLWWVLHAFFLMGAEVSDPENAHPEYRKRSLSGGDVARLEAEMARVEASIEFPRSFLVSAGTVLAAEADVAATVVRDFERALVALKEERPAFEGEVMLRFVNRLSDYFFLLARVLEGEQRLPVDYGELDEGEEV